MKLTHKPIFRRSPFGKLAKQMLVVKEAYEALDAYPEGTTSFLILSNRLKREAAKLFPAYKKYRNKAL